MPLAEIALKLQGQFLGDEHSRAGFLLLVAFLVSFLFIRTSARLMRSPRVPWWPGSVQTGDLHIHHLVFGIVLLMASGFLVFALEPGSPWFELLAMAFGVGCGLTLDEFALWLRLEDVYWADEGRRSIDAVIVATIIGGAIVLGLVPLQAHQGGSISAVIGAVATEVAICTVAVLKGKIWSGLIGMFIPLVSLTAAIRLAKPNSPWARRRYPSEGKKMSVAAARDDRSRRRYRRWQELIGGAPAR